MTGLVEFLTARLDEDEAEANEDIEFHKDNWEDRGESRPDLGLHSEYDLIISPFRVLRDVAAKRRVLERHAECGTGYGYCDDAGHVMFGGRCPDLKDAVAPYDNHPEYDPGWRP